MKTISLRVLILSILYTFNTYALRELNEAIEITDKKKCPLSKTKGDCFALREYSLEVAKKIIPCGGKPFMAKFQSGKTILTFIGAHHEFGPPEVNKTFQFIERVLPKNPSNLLKRPTAIFVEGLSSNPSDHGPIKEEVLKACEDTNFATCREPYFLGSKARHFKIPYQGVDLSPKELIKALAPKYSAKDHACILTLLLFQQGAFQNLELYATQAAEHSGIPYTPTDFLNCYKDKMGTSFSTDSFDKATTTPSQKPGSNFFQKLMAIMTELRDQHILKTLKTSLDQHDDVLMVLGAGHLVTQMDSLMEITGDKNPSFICEPQ